MDGYSLVLCIWRGRHIVLPVDQLVPQPVIGELHEVVVGELTPGEDGVIGSLPATPRRCSGCPERESKGMRSF